MSSLTTLNTINPSFNIERAPVDAGPMLSELALRSKAYWPYEVSFIEACRADLTITKEFISTNDVFVVKDDENTLGFFSFSIDEAPLEMIHFFVDPLFIRKGIGSFMWEYSIEFAKNAGWNSFVICADPYAAEKFYLPKGCINNGEVESSVQSGRFLPFLKYQIESLA